MSHARDPGSPHDHSLWYWFFILAGIAIGMSCGTWGYMIYGAEQSGHSSVTSAVYHAMQLFFLHMPHLEGRVNYWLEIGRWAAALATGMTGILFLRKVLLFEWSHLCFKVFTRRHVVICGLGEVGTRIVAELSKKQRHIRVVAIERDHGMPGVAEAEKRGALIVIGDARRKETLVRAKAHRARHVLAVCAGDDTNIAIASALQELAAESKNMPQEEVTCQILWDDAQLRSRLGPALERNASTYHSKVRVRGIDVPELIARKTFLDHPPDFEGIARESSSRVHWVLMGTCGQARALAVKALQMCHYANASRLRLTVVSADAETFLANLREQHPGADAWYDAHPVAPEGHGLPEVIIHALDADAYLTVAVFPQCRGTTIDKAESLAVVTAMTVAGQLDELANSASNRPKRGRVLVCLRERTGFGKFLENRVGVPVHAFGAAEAYCDPDVLLHEIQDSIAKKLNDDYRRRFGGESWEGLDETLRDSNRLAADHIPVKLRAMGMELADNGHGEPVDLSLFKNPRNDASEPDPRLMILAQMEHSRWCAERWLLGWQHGDPAVNGDENQQKGRKYNRCLIGWEHLPAADRKKDLQQIRALPAALALARKRIVTTPTHPAKPVTNR